MQFFGINMYVLILSAVISLYSICLIGSGYAGGIMSSAIDAIKDYRYETRAEARQSIFEYKERSIYDATGKAVNNTFSKIFHFLRPIEVSSVIILFQLFDVFAYFFCSLFDGCGISINNNFCV